MDKIFRKIDNPKTLRIISWGMFIGGNIIYLADLIPQLWFYPFGLFVGAGTAFFDYIAIGSQEYHDELDKIQIEYEVKHQAKAEEFKKLKKEYGIDDED